MNNSPNNGNSRKPSETSYSLDYDVNAGRANPTQRRPQNVQTQSQRPPMTEEERRRIAAARAARMKMSGQGAGGQTRPNPNNPNGQVRRDANGRPVPARTAGQNPYPGGQRPPQRRPQESLSRRKKRKVKINAGAVIFVLIVGTVIGVSAYQISRNPDVLDNTGDLSMYDSIIADARDNIAGDLPGGKDSAVSPETTETLENPETTPVQEETSAAGGLAFRTVTVPSASVNEGDLVLVNYNYPFDRIDDVELKIAYTERTGKIKVSSTTLGMEPEAFDALERMVVGLVADTECDDLLLYSGHRTLADQQRIWDSNMTNYGEEYTKTYVAVPAHSEHHTGYACDLGFYTDDGASIPLVDHEFGPWVWEHCTEYGYVLRYPAEKAEITGIGHEQWHFRYVGIAHAYAMDSLGFCMEEYIDHMKAYTADAQLVHIGADRSVNYVLPSDLANLSTGWITYYVPASEGDTTDIRIPDAAKYADYEISGNNVDGFIVTITLG